MAPDRQPGLAIISCMVFPPSNPNLRSCGPVLALILKPCSGFPPVVGSVWKWPPLRIQCLGPFRMPIRCPYAQSFPLSVHISAMSEDCSLQVRTGAGPPRRRRRPKRRCKGLSDMSMPMPKNVPRRAGAKIQIQREPTSCVRLIWRCFFGPQMEGWIARKPCLTPAHPSSRELNIYTN